jgi:hypothetical protein
MLYGLFIIIISGVISFSIIDRLKKRYPFVDAAVLKKLFFYHLLLTFAYYAYALFNPSDSKGYYERAIVNTLGSWFEYYGTSTTFITFVGYPFIRYLGFSYEAVMLLFSFFGFLGFVYFYVFFKENIKFKHTLFGYDLMLLMLFLPNLHFWSSSFGKGSIIFLGIGLYFFGISKIRHRYIAAIIGGVIIYHVRPHVMLVTLVSSAIGFVFSTKGIGIFWRLVFLAGASIVFFYIYSDVLTLVGIDEEAFLSEGLDLTRRAQELTKATSGVDITSYSLPMQVFTFLYRPLFIDAPGMLGLIVSFENVFYLFISLKLFSTLRGVRFLITGSFLVKSAFLSFLSVSIALAQIAGNLGLAMRQKSQVMILLMFVIIAFMDDQKIKQASRVKRRSRVPMPDTIAPASIETTPKG